ncbi:efflux RND transporter periplasmic adaptor subunit [Planotetraspora mira]|uniref:Peptidoglycan-binding protein n=1 Tax=Planotetraspora mira TaxID=58121 RepID=A0A8J3XAS7_9ACTN|nr:peptidoglycan-binding protein [Planotetraspora mira]GII29808.1 peptidoglycan-binding protein [Planotetraspora mira]
MGSSSARRLTAVAAVVALGAAVAGILLLRSAGDEPAGPRTGGGTVHTVAVTRTDLAATTTLPGALGYGVERPVAGGGGRVTWLPKSGAVVSRGRQLFRVDDRPVVLFYGGTPLFRRLDTPGIVGRDVKVVADNLRALGYDIGPQPAVGATVTRPAGGGHSSPPAAGATTVQPDATGSEPGNASPPPQTTPVKVRKGDAVLTTSLIGAIRRWQGKAGLPPSGVLDAGDVVVLPHKVRVGAVTAHLGDEAAAPVVSVTPTTKVVTVQAQPLEAESIRSAGKATVTLPDGATTRGTVTSVGRIAETPQGGAGPNDQPELTATVRIDDPAKVRRLDAAPVQVEFTGEVRRGVLAVPVGALLALSEGGYGLQTDGGDLVAVTTGLFVKGMVEIRGTGIAEGTRVVTTS